MSSKFDFLVGMAGWEDRYVLGMQHNLQFLSDEAKVSCFYTTKYQNRTSANRLRVEEILSKNDVPYNFFEIEEEGTSSAFLKMRENVERLGISEGARVLLDISTMNRENIWYSLYILALKSADVHFVYYPSERFGEGALTLDPSRPRFLFKMSGQPALGKSTGVLVLTGYDSERTKHFIRHFDPAEVSLGVQTGNQLGNAERNISEHEDVNFSDCDIFEVDAFDLSSTKYKIVEKALELSGCNNVVVTSLGPKVSSVSCFEVWSMFQNISLAYIPVDDVSESYSSGIDINRMSGPTKVAYAPTFLDQEICEFKFSKNSDAFIALMDINQRLGIPLPDGIRIDIETGHTILSYQEKSDRQDALTAAKLTYT